MGSQLSKNSSASGSLSKSELHKRLRPRDKLLIAILMPLWAVSLVLHLDLAIDDQLFRTAILLEDPTTDNGYPVVGEILSEAKTLVAERDIRLGDEILSIGDRQLQGISGYRASIIAHSFIGDSDQITATFQRDGITFTRAYPLSGFGIPRWWPTLFAVSFGVVGLLVLLNAPQSQTARAIFPAFIFFALSWLVFAGRSELQTFFSTMVFGVSMIFAGPLVLRAMMLLPENTAIRSKLLRNSVWIFSLMIVSGLSAFTGWPFSTATGQAAHLAFMSLFYLSILVLLARNYIKADTLGRRQLRWVMLGFYLAFVPAMLVTAFVIQYPDQFSLYALSSIGMPIVPLMFLVAITHYNLFDIDRLIGGSVSYSILIVLIAVLAEAVVEPMVAMTGTRFGFDGNTVQIMFVGGLSAMLIPAERRWRPLVDRVFFANNVAVEDTVSALIDQLEETDQLSIDEQFELIGERLKKAYGLKQWGIVEMKDPGLSSTAGSVSENLPSSLWQKYSKRARPGMETIGAEKNNLIAPIRPGGKLAWLLVLGPKSSGDVYTTTDNGLIASLAFVLADNALDL